MSVYYDNFACFSYFPGLALSRPLTSLLPQVAANTVQYIKVACMAALNNTSLRLSPLGLYSDID